MTAAQIAAVEELVNREVLANNAVDIHLDIPLAEAKERGAMALFGEKYGDTVRMIEIPGTTGDFSLELCGGTHVARTGDIGPFRIVSEASSAAGVRRIEAVAGEPALGLAAAERAELAAVMDMLRRDGGSAAGQVRDLIAERDELSRDLRAVKQASAAGSLDEMFAAAVAVGDLKVLAAAVQAEDRDALLQLGDRARDKMGEKAVVVLAAEWEGKATLLVTLSPDLVDAKRLHAGNLVKALAAKVGGRGGGRPNTAQAGLPGSEAIAPALAAAVEVVTEQIAG